MEDKKKTIEDLHREYTQLCTKAGHLNYQIAVLSEDLKIVYNTLKDLNFEAAKLSEENNKAKEAEAATSGAV